MLEPESIQTVKTKALDETWADRLQLLNREQLYIDILKETDITKLQLLLEMFGVGVNVIPEELTTLEYQRLLQSIILIYRLSGTPKSIKLIGYVLGATRVNVIQNYVLRYNNTANYNDLWCYDSGKLHRHFAVNLEVEGIVEADRTTFEIKLKSMFNLFQPMWIWLEKVDFI
jgi:hypothetical protein